MLYRILNQSPSTLRRPGKPEQSIKTNFLASRPCVAGEARHDGVDPSSICVSSRKPIMYVSSGRWNAHSRGLIIRGWFIWNAPPHKPEPAVIQISLRDRYPMQVTPSRHSRPARKSYGTFPSPKESAHGQGDSHAINIFALPRTPESPAQPR